VLGFKQNQGVVHHHDEDRSNNDPSNLRAMHQACHTIHHQLGRKRSSETKERIRTKLKGKPKSPEHIEALKHTHVGMTGKTHSPKTRAKMSAARITYLRSRKI
jgi:hypothetical protein